MSDLLAIGKIEWIRNLNSVAKSRLASGLALKEYSSGEILCREGEHDEVIFFVLKGCLKIFHENNQVLTPISGGGLWRNGSDDKDDFVREGFIAKQVLLKRETPNPFAVAAQEASTILLIDKERFQELVTSSPSLYKDIIASSIYKDVSILSCNENKTNKTLKKNNLYWMITAIVVPVLTTCLLNLLTPGIGSDEASFIGIVVAALILWASELVPMFAPALLILLGLALFSIAPVESVLSGFGSKTFLFMVGLYSLGGLLKSSGLAYRLCLLILSIVPASQAMLSATLFILGLILNPILPSATSRSSILSPLLIDFKNNLSLPDRSKNFTSMSMSVYAGISLFSFSFLSSKSENLILFALLPEQVRDAFSYGKWFLNSLVVAIPLLVMLLIVYSYNFKQLQPISINRTQIQNQLTMLGKLSELEVQSISCIILFIVGSVTVALHGIAMVWISVLLLFYLMLAGMVSSNTLKNTVDWQFLLFLASIIGFSNSIGYSHLDEILGNSLSVLDTLITTNMYLFFVLLTVVIYLLRFLLPPKLCAPLLATIFFPIFISQNVNPWFFAIACLLLCDSAFLPYQHATLANFLSETNSECTLDRRHFLALNAVINFLRPMALLFSVWTWSSLQVL